MHYPAFLNKDKIISVSCGFHLLRNADDVFRARCPEDGIQPCTPVRIKMRIAFIENEDTRPADACRCYRDKDLLSPAQVLHIPVEQPGNSHHLPACTDCLIGLFAHGVAEAQR